MASISRVKKKNLALDFLKKTTQHITGAVGEYFTEAMPTVGDIAGEAKRAFSQGISVSSNTVSRLKDLKSQNVFKSLLNWYMDKGRDFDSYEDIDSQLDFDVDSDNEVSVAQISETIKGSNQISKSVVESTHKLAEAHIASTANIVGSVDRLTAITTSGFEKVNSTLSSILEILTKNTATMIEAQVATAESIAGRESKEDLLSNSFNFRQYKESVIREFQNSPIGMMLSMAPSMLTSAKQSKPQDLFKMGFEVMMDKFFDSTSVLKQIDKTINDAIVGGLVRLHGKGDNFFTQTLANLFGIDTRRSEFSYSKNRLDVKAVAFDSITRESIVTAIPGYLRKILVAVGGEDLVYDNRSRGFRSQKAIVQEFNETAATRNIAEKINNKKFDDLGSYESLILDLIANKEGWHSGGSGASREHFSEMLKDRSSIKKYIDNLLSNIEFSKSSKADRMKANEAFIDRLQSLDVSEQEDLYNAIARETINRKSRISSFLEKANKYDIDLTGIEDSEENDFNTILNIAGLKKKQLASIKGTGSQLTPVQYSHSALYEIFRRLDEGINVFQVGHSEDKTSPFEKMGEEYLKAPINYKQRQLKNSFVTKATQFTYSSNSYLDKPEQEVDELGEPKFTIDAEGNRVPVMKESSRGDRLKNWTKRFSSDFLGAVFSGDGKRLQNTLITLHKDLATSAGKLLTQGAKIANDKSGNILGYLKHMVTGRGYTYTGDEGKPVKVEENKRGGIVGYVNELIFGPGGIKGASRSISSKTMNWVTSVAKYFDYSDTPGKFKSGTRITNIRKRILGTSAGALIGSNLGIIGGPIGLILGAVAGNAFSQTDGIGAKIKEFIFGKDEVDEHGNFTGKRKLGYLNRVVNWVIDPVRYQIGKTASALGGVLKKNLLGPLSDIGFVIKDRMADAAANTVKSTFGPIVKGAKWLFQKALYYPLLSATKAITGTAIVQGNLVRGGMNVAGGVVGATLGTTANILAGRNEELRDKLNERRHKRAIEVDMDRAESGYFGSYDIKSVKNYLQRAKGAKESGDMDSYHDYMMKAADIKRTGESVTKTSSGLFGDYKNWKAQVDERRKNIGKFSDYVSESPVVEASETTAKNTSDLLEVMKDHISEGAFSVRDKVLEEKIDRLSIGFSPDEDKLSKDRKKELKNQYKDSLKPIPSTISGEKENSDFDRRQQVAASLATGVVAGATIKGITPSEQRTVDRVVGEALKGKHSSQSILGNLKQYFRDNQDTSGEEGSKDKRPWWKKLLDGVSGIVSNWKLWLAGGALLALLKGGFTDVINTTASTIFDIGGRIIDGIKGVFSFIWNGKGSGMSSWMNAFTAPFDMKIDHPTDYVNPLADVKHVRTDAEGNDIVNTTATNAKNRPWYVIAKDALKHGISQIRGETNVPAASKTSKAVVRGMSRLGKGLIGGDILGRAYGTIGKYGSKLFGADEERSEFIGRAIEVIGSYRATRSIIKGKGLSSNIFNWAIDILTKLINKISDLLMAHFPKAVDIKTFLSSLIKRITPKFFDTVKTRFLFLFTKESGKAGLGVASGGIATGIFAGAGMFFGGYNTSSLFMVPDEEADFVMKSISSTLGAILDGIPYIGLLEIFDILLIGGPEQRGIRQILAEKLYISISGIEALEKKQGYYKAALDKYNKNHNTKLTLREYVDMAKPGLLNSIFGGSKIVDYDTGEIIDTTGFGERITGIFSSEQAAKNAIQDAKSQAYHKRKELEVYEMWRLEQQRLDAIRTGKKFDTSILNDRQKELLKQIDDMEDSKYNATFNTNITGSIENASKSRYRVAGTASEKEDKYQSNRDEYADVRNLGFDLDALITPSKTEADVKKEYEDYSRKAIDMENKHKIWLFERKRQDARDRGERYIPQTDGEREWERLLDNMPDEQFDQYFKDVTGYFIHKASRGRYRKDEPLPPKPSDFKYYDLPSHFGGPEDTTVGTSSETTPEEKKSPSISTGKIPSPYLGGKYRMTSPYGNRILKGKPGFHSGVDLVGTTKDIGSVAEATVTRVHRGETHNAKQGGRGYGNFVEYETPDGYKFINAHMKAGSIPSNISTGTKLSPGDYIGKEGDTGHSYGSHLHFEVRHPKASRDGSGKNTINPAPYLSGETLANTGRFSPGGTMTTDTISQISSSSEISEETSLSNLMKKIAAAGNRFLYNITGGLIGSKESDETTSISSHTNQVTKVLQSEPELLTNEEVNKLNLPEGPATILDLNTGTSYNIYWTKPKNHSEYSTMTATDTAAKKSTVGNWSWIPRPVILKIGKHCIAAGTNSFPHGIIIGTARPDLPNNNSGAPSNMRKWELGGHFCLWYKDSTSNNPNLTGNSYAEAMRNAAVKAYELAKQQRDAIAAPGYISGNKDNESRIHDFFSAKGLTPAAVAAIMGTIAQESNFDPKAKQRLANGGIGPGRGLFQWEVDGRFKELEKFAKSRGTTWDDLDTQLEFAWKELQNSDTFFKGAAKKNWIRKGVNPYPDGVNGFFADTDVENAAKAFDAAFTRSADATQGYTENGVPYKGAGRIEKRVSKARSFFEKWRQMAANKTSTISNSTIPPIADGVGGPDNKSAIIHELTRDRALDDVEGGIGGPLDMFDKVLGGAHTIAKEFGHEDKMRNIPKSTNDIFSNITKEIKLPADMKIPTTPKGMMEFAKSQIGKLPFDDITRDLDKELKNVSKIKIPGTKSTVGSVVEKAVSDLKLPQLIDSIPNKVDKIFREIPNDTSYRPQSQSPIEMEIQNLGETLSSSMNMRNVEALLTSVLQELKSINGNTATSGSLMQSLNENVVASQSRVRNTIKAMANTTKPKLRLEPNAKDVATVGSIIRGS